MKTLIIILLSFSFYSCKKCAECTRTWTYEKKQVGADGHVYSTTWYDGETEYFDVCGKDEIDEAQGRKETFEVVGDPTHLHEEITGVGTCGCVTK